MCKTRGVLKGLLLKGGSTFWFPKRGWVPLTWTGQILSTPLLMRVMVSILTSFKVSANFNLLNISVLTRKQKNSSVSGVINTFIHEPCPYWSTPNVRPLFCYILTRNLGRMSLGSNQLINQRKKPPKNKTPKNKQWLIWGYCLFAVREEFETPGI